MVLKYLWKTKKFGLVEIDAIRTDLLARKLDHHYYEPARGENCVRGSFLLQNLIERCTKDCDSRTLLLDLT